MGSLGTSLRPPREDGGGVAVCVGGGAAFSLEGEVGTAASWAKVHHLRDFLTDHWPRGGCGGCCCWGRDGDCSLDLACFWADGPCVVPSSLGRPSSWAGIKGTGEARRRGAGSTGANVAAALAAGKWSESGHLFAVDGGTGLKGAKSRWSKVAAGSEELLPRRLPGVELKTEYSSAKRGVQPESCWLSKWLCLGVWGSVLEKTAMDVCSGGVDGRAFGSPKLQEQEGQQVHCGVEGLEVGPRGEGGGGGGSLAGFGYSTHTRPGPTYSSPLAAPWGSAVALPGCCLLLLASTHGNSDYCLELLSLAEGIGSRIYASVCRAKWAVGGRLDWLAGVAPGAFDAQAARGVVPCIMHSS